MFTTQLPQRIHNTTLFKKKVFVPTTSVQQLLRTLSSHSPEPYESIDKQNKSIKTIDRQNSIRQRGQFVSTVSNKSFFAKPLFDLEPLPKSVKRPTIKPGRQKMPTSPEEQNTVQDKYNQRLWNYGKTVYGLFEETKFLSPQADRLQNSVSQSSTNLICHDSRVQTKYRWKYITRSPEAFSRVNSDFIKIEKKANTRVPRHKLQPDFFCKQVGENLRTRILAEMQNPG